MKKKCITILIAGVIGMQLFSGCGATGSDSQPAAGEHVEGGTVSPLFTGKLEENVTIRVLENDTAIERGYFAALIEAFNEAYADYGIQAVDANMDQYLDLANDGPYGYGPDVLYQANDILMKYVAGKHILPLPVETLDCYGQVPEAAWAAYQAPIDGKVYTCGVPVNVQAPMLYYRKDLLPENWPQEWDDNQNNIPDMLESWNDMFAFSQEIRQTDASRYGFMQSIYEVYFSSGYLFSYGGYVFGNNNTDPEDIGFGAADAQKGAWVLKQLASVMNEETIDDTITRNAYSKLGAGTYFAVISTPDTYTTFLKELSLGYQKEGLSQEEADAKAKENLVITTLPMLPESGDLSEENPTLITNKTMGGMNGYAVSAYTKAPNACLAFVDFASSYEMMMLRSEYLGIAPARSDAAKQAGEMSSLLFARLEEGNIMIMPSVTAVAQIWTPAQTFFSDIAKDAFRPAAEQKYMGSGSFQEGLDAMCKQIYDAIFTLSTSN